MCVPVAASTGAVVVCVHVRVRPWSYWSSCPDPPLASDAIFQRLAVVLSRSVVTGPRQFLG